MKPVFFKTSAEFRKWRDKNYDKETELLVGFYKKGTGKPSITWPESVDVALCYGWIDGVRRSYNEDSYTIRFTPRKANSTWSTININKMQELMAKGLVKPEGIAAFEKRKEANSEVYAYEKKGIEALSKDYEAAFKGNKAAWDFFVKQAPSYKKVIIHWIMSAKQEKTRLSRLEKAIKASEEGKRL
jgi:uncharacterized protein YdeI (YjbR/CyaY-like superfamily)